SVVNILAMSADEACETAANGGGSLCMRIARTADGTVVTQSNIKEAVGRRALLIPLVAAVSAVLSIIGCASNAIAQAISPIEGSTHLLPKPNSTESEMHYALDVSESLCAMKNIKEKRYGLGAALYKSRKFIADEIWRIPRWIDRREFEMYIIHCLDCTAGAVGLENIKADLDLQIDFSQDSDRLIRLDVPGPIND
ncbi:MAG: hypothetical protein K2X29_01540, partial [Candidatus Obscuribacterales bacterium]|nr:hypothetical protein [Candidatus Obscuribacterales bacterium]